MCTRPEQSEKDVVRLLRVGVYIFSMGYQIQVIRNNDLDDIQMKCDRVIKKNNEYIVVNPNIYSLNSEDLGISELDNADRLILNADTVVAILGGEIEK